MARLALPPSAAIVVVVVPNREGLDEPVKGNGTLRPQRTVRRHLLGRKDVEEKTDVRPVTHRVASKIGRREHREREFRKNAALRGNGERFGGRCAVPCKERSDGLPDAGSVRVGHEQTHVIPEVLERLLLLQDYQRIGKNGGAPRVERVDGERPHVGMLDEIALQARRQDLAGDRGSADGRLRQVQRRAHFSEQAARIMLGRRRVQRPQRMDVVNAGKDAAIAHRDHRWDVDRGDPAEQSFPHGRHVVLRPRGGPLHPLGPELRPPQLPEGP